MRSRAQSRSQPPVAGRHPGGRPRSQDADAAILQATAELLAEVGLAETSISAVAARSGVARGTIYRRWPSRATMIAAAIRQSIGRDPYPLTGVIETDIRLGGEQARAILSEPTFHAVLPMLVGVMLEGGRPDEGITFDSLAPNRRLVGREYARLAQGAGLRTDVDPEVVMDLVFGALLSRLLATGEPPTPAIVDQVLDIVLRGVRLNEPPIVGEQPTATNRRR